MEDLIDTLTRGNVAAVKIVLASVVTILAFYQVFLMAVGYGKLRLPFIRPPAASATHRAVGDTVMVVTLAVAFMCLTYFGVDDSGKHGSDAGSSIHAIPGTLLLAVLTLKVIVVRWWHGMNRFLPALGVSVFGLFAITWLSSAFEFVRG